MAATSLCAAIENLWPLIRSAAAGELDNALALLQGCCAHLEERLQQEDCDGASPKSTSHRRRESTKLRIQGMDSKLKKTFHELDTTGNGCLSFDDFLRLLRRGDANFNEEAAVVLFNRADQDGGGQIDFEEFVDFVFDNQDHERLFEKYAPRNRAEKKAKEAVATKSLQMRQAAAEVVKSEGRVWGELSWQERLEEIHELETAQDSDAEEATAGSPETTAPLPSGENAAAAVEPATPTAQTPKSNPQTPSKKGKKGHYIADMSQPQLVDYSVTSDDLRFARGYPEAEGELGVLKDYLKTVGPPTDSLEIVKYIAKGTAGWVFVAEWKNTKQRVAMKLIRMTQVRTGLREWYISKVLRKAGLPNIVFTAEDVFVIPKEEAPPVVAEQLANAGPVPYYVCLCQDFMSGGTVEDLVEKGLSPQMMFKAMEDVAQTLADMHANNVQHRDVKPENVLVEMRDGELVAAKLCDFGSAELGENEKGRADDVRRFGITVFALATGEVWTKNRLIREEHQNLVRRLEMMAGGCDIPAMQKLPALLRNIFNDSPPMADVADSIRRLRATL